MSSKTRVAVLFGGRSSEHEVSLQSAANVMQYLDTSRFDVVPIGINKKGNWLIGKDIFMNSVAQNAVPILDNQTWFTADWVGTPVKAEQQIVKANPTVHTQFDVIFPAVHGTFCEDGTLQGLLELANIPYVGCGVLSSSVGMDKDVAKRLAMQAGIKVGPYLVVKKAQWQTAPQPVLAQVDQTLSFPVFVKPANTGSSIGINKVKSIEALEAAIDEAFQYDTKILIEKAINAVELEIAVLESLEPGADPIVSIVGEIRSHHEFYSYEAKYLDEAGAALLLPAPVSEAVSDAARKIAQALFIKLECEGMARIDLFLDKDTQEIYFNEINTLPGFTKISMYPKLMEASGVSYTALLTHLVDLAVNRYENKNKLIRTYVG
ncbi:MAG TPA: D-alanine--D-alanine ligase family protein [Gammaproteobacteria bacterium]|jgi:D-alanine-D-alanine ligase|nr:D-alanine--D-alanine ligase family protein [Gammaproteobacteria bacterium]